MSHPEACPRCGANWMFSQYNRDCPECKRNWWDEEFVFEAEQFKLWQYFGRELTCAANVLLDRYDEIGRAIEQGTIKISDPALLVLRVQTVMMLYGMAVENLIKSLIVARGKIPVIAGAKLSNEVKTHNLVALFKLAAVTVSPEEAELLGRLSNAIEIRYPIGTKPGQTTGRWDLQNDFPLIGELASRVEQELYTVRPHEALPPINLLKLCRKN